MKLLDLYPSNLSVSLEETRYDMFANAAREAGAKVRFSADSIEVEKNARTIRLHKQHIIYLRAVIRYFEFYWESVEPRDEFGKQVCDFTPNRYHRVIGFDLMPVLFPSLAEPVSTINQYLEFAGLQMGHTVVDLGAYAGLSGILFKQVVGQLGRVIALEPDPVNYRCATVNLDLFNRLTGQEIELLNCAVWIDDRGLAFSSDGCMGSSAQEYIGARGASISVPTITLDGLFTEHSLERVDLLKCDIEGAEDKIFGVSSLLRTSVRKIVVEIHNPPSGLTSEILVPQLESMGFRCQLVKQYGVDLPLLFAVNANI